MPRKKKDAAEALSARREQLRAEHAEAVRERIQTGAVLNALQEFALGNTKMTGTRLKAIEVLLDKTLPNLATVKHEVDPVQVTFNIQTTYTPPETNDGA